MQFRFIVILDEILQKSNSRRYYCRITGFFDKICHMVQDRMMEHSEKKIKINVILFDFHGAILGRRDSE